MDTLRLYVTNPAMRVSTSTEFPVNDLDEAIDRLCATDPQRRPSVAAALSLLSEELPEDAKPWPPWAGGDSFQHGPR